MLRFNFEKNLEHQTQAVDSTVDVFNGLDIQIATGPDSIYINPFLDKDKGFKYIENIRNIQIKNGIKENIKKIVI
ncbi:hypothetical protein PL321_19070 [Caloramator sp. mosi_1]|uniref:hypothetical protein n=1 Tax=Caloramator sp. mosi_1 TaxID=3023090 RepID=UPI0023602D56|nr:hypothetical protein [Caloramator sp. mosi_1]WDC84272.1 hypothetical protein PL321_19070 [Caloramator sp. mosi_1]